MQNQIFSHIKQPLFLEKTMFDAHCQTLAMGLAIPFSDAQKNITYIRTFHELNRQYPQLSHQIKVSMKEKYHLN